MILYPARLKDEGITYAETLPHTVLELDDAHARSEQPVAVDITAQRDQESILVYGSISTTVRVLCGRCNDWIAWPLNQPSFQTVLEPPHGDLIDLTPLVREEILLQLPVVPMCSLDKNFRCPLNNQLYPPLPEETSPLQGPDPWSELNKIKDKIKSKD